MRNDVPFSHVCVPFIIMIINGTHTCENGTKLQPPGEDHCHGPQRARSVGTESFCVMSRLIHTGLGSSSIIAHVVHSPPPPPANSCVIGPAVINTHTQS